MGRQIVNECESCRKYRRCRVDSGHGIACRDYERDEKYERHKQGVRDITHIHGSRRNKCIG